MHFILTIVGFYTFNLHNILKSSIFYRLGLLLKLRQMLVRNRRYLEVIYLTENIFEREKRKKYLEIFSAIKLKNKSIEDYEVIFDYTLKLPPKIISVVAKDIIDDWSCSDILFYLEPDIRDERIICYRQVYINGMSYTERNWFMYHHATFPINDELYDITLNALANKVPFEVVRRFLVDPIYDFYYEKNNQLIKMFLRRGFTIAESLYLTYISIKYNEKIKNECEILIKKKYDINIIEEEINGKYSREN